MKIRYEVLWCETGHEDFHYKYFKEQEIANSFARTLIAKNRTFHGCCSIYEQEAIKYSDEVGPFINWERNKSWECSDLGIVEL